MRADGRGNPIPTPVNVFGSLHAAADDVGVGVGVGVGVVVGGGVVVAVGVAAVGAVGDELEPPHATTTTAARMSSDKRGS
jgi:hypothetical protein